MSTPEREQLEKAITAQESLRGTLDDVIIDAAIATLKEKLAALESAPAEQRKLATILFMDIAGHTALVRDLDPEEQMALVDPLLARFAARVEEFGGHVARYQGDGFKAVFGLPTARENDPQQAVRASLAIQEEAAEVAVELEAERDIPDFHVRVGIATGLVFAGGKTEGEDTIKGIPVNLAARLEAAAEPGTVLVSRDTLSHIQGVFDIEALPPIQARGFDGEVPVFKILRAKARPFYRSRRGVEGVETRMIGREIEFSRLKKMAEEVLSDGELQIATVVGDAGIGKSRLLYEFENWVDLRPETFRLFKGRARMETQSLPFALLRDLMAFRFEILEGDSLSEVQNKFEDGFREALGENEQASLYAYIVGYWLGHDFAEGPNLTGSLDDPEQLHARGIVYLERYFSAVATRSPILLLLEDLHWADDSSLGAINQLALALLSQPILIIGAARHSLYEHRPHWGEGQSFHRRLELRPLSKRDCRNLVSNVLQKIPEIPGMLADLLVTNAEGNPFYVEELVKMLVEGGVIIPGDVNWQVVQGRLAELKVPQTLMGVLQARLDALSVEEKRILQQASVVGRVFWDRALEHFHENEQQTVLNRELEAVLEELRGRELVYCRETSTFEDAKEHIFKHALLRDVAYESVRINRRKKYHALAAEWLVAHAKKRIGEISGLIAEQFAQAEDHDAAQSYFYQAGKAAAARFANDEAIRYFSRTLALLDDAADRERFSLLLDRERVYDIKGERKAQRSDLDQIASIAGETGDREFKFKAALRRTEYAEKTSDYTTALADADQAVSLARELGESDKEVASLLASGRAYWRMGQLDRARSQINQALEIARLEGLDPLAAHALRHLGILAFEQRELSASKTWNQESLAVYRKIGDRMGEAMAINNIGNADKRMGDFDSAHANYGAALTLARDMGFRMLEGTVLQNIGWSHSALGNYSSAAQYFRQALQIHLQVGNKQSEGYMILSLSYLAYIQGNFAEVQDLAEKGLALFRSIGDERLECVAIWHLGNAHLGLGRMEKAKASILRAVDLRERIGEAHEVALGLESLARFYLAANELEKAGAQVERMLAFFMVRENLEKVDREDVFLPFLTCYKVLQALGDSRAPDVLAAGHQLLQEYLDSLPSKEMQDSFRNQVPWNRELADLWETSWGG